MKFLKGEHPIKMLKSPKILKEQVKSSNGTPIKLPTISFSKELSLNKSLPIKE